MCVTDVHAIEPCHAKDVEVVLGADAGNAEEIFRQISHPFYDKEHHRLPGGLCPWAIPILLPSLRN